MRCPEHGLAVGPDGSCVLCRRNRGPAGSTAPPPTSFFADTTWVGPNAIVLALVAAAMAILLTIRFIAGLGPFAPARAIAERERTGRYADDRQGRGDDPMAEDAPADPEGAADPDDPATTDAVPVVVYYTTWCPHCRRARAWLDEHQVPYRAFDVESDRDAAREMRRWNPSGAVPTIVVDGRPMSGFDPRALERQLEAAAQRRRGE
jgi:glutaredoxin 3